MTHYASVCNPENWPNKTNTNRNNPCSFRFGSVQFGEPTLSGSPSYVQQTISTVFLFTYSYPPGVKMTMPFVLRAFSAKVEGSSSANVTPQQKWCFESRPSSLLFIAVMMVSVASPDLSLWSNQARRIEASTNSMPSCLCILDRCCNLELTADNFWA